MPQQQRTGNNASAAQTSRTAPVRRDITANDDEQAVNVFCRGFADAFAAATAATGGGSGGSGGGAAAAAAASASTPGSDESKRSSSPAPAWTTVLPSDVLRRDDAARAFLTCLGLTTYFLTVFRDPELFGIKAPQANAAAASTEGSIKNTKPAFHVSEAFVRSVVNRSTELRNELRLITALLLESKKVQLDGSAQANADASQPHDPVMRLRQIFASIHWTPATVVLRQLWKSETHRLITLAQAAYASAISTGLAWRRAQQEEEEEFAKLKAQQRLSYRGATSMLQPVLESDSREESLTTELPSSRPALAEAAGIVLGSLPPPARASNPASLEEVRQPSLSALYHEMRSNQGLVLQGAVANVFEALIDGLPQHTAAVTATPRRISLAAIAVRVRGVAAAHTMTNMSPLHASMTRSGTPSLLEGGSAGSSTSPVVRPQSHRYSISPSGLSIFTPSVSGAAGDFDSATGLNLKAALTPSIQWSFRVVVRAAMMVLHLQRQSRRIGFGRGGVSARMEAISSRPPTSSTSRSGVNGSSRNSGRDSHGQQRLPQNAMLRPISKRAHAMMRAAASLTGSSTVSAASRAAAARQRALDAKFTSFAEDPAVDELEWISDLLANVVFACHAQLETVVAAARRKCITEHPSVSAQHSRWSMPSTVHITPDIGTSQPSVVQVAVPTDSSNLAKDFDSSNIRYVLVSVLSDLRHINAHKSGSESGHAFRREASSTGSIASTVGSSSSGPRGQSRNRVRVLARLGYNDSYYREATERILLDSGFGRRILPPAPRARGAIALQNGREAPSLEAHRMHSRKNFMFCRQVNGGFGNGNRPRSDSGAQSQKIAAASHRLTMKLGDLSGRTSLRDLPVGGARLEHLRVAHDWGRNSGAGGGANSSGTHKGASDQQPGVAGEFDVDSIPSEESRWQFVSVGSADFSAAEVRQQFLPHVFSFSRAHAPMDAHKLSKMSSSEWDFLLVGVSTVELRVLLAQACPFVDLSSCRVSFALELVQQERASILPSTQGPSQRGSSSTGPSQSFADRSREFIQRSESNDRLGRARSGRGVISRSSSSVEASSGEGASSTSAAASQSGDAKAQVTLQSQASTRAAWAGVRQSSLTDEKNASHGRFRRGQSDRPSAPHGRRSTDDNVDPTSTAPNYCRWFEGNGLLVDGATIVMPVPVPSTMEDYFDQVKTESLWRRPFERIVASGCKLLLTASVFCAVVGKSSAAKSRAFSAPSQGLRGGASVSQLPAAKLAESDTGGDMSAGLQKVATTSIDLTATQIGLFQTHDDWHDLALTQSFETHLAHELTPLPVQENGRVRRTHRTASLAMAASAARATLHADFDPRQRSSKVARQPVGDSAVAPASLRLAVCVMDPYFLSRAKFEAQHAIVQDLDKQNKQAKKAQLKYDNAFKTNTIPKQMLRAVLESEQRASREESWKFAEFKKNRERVISRKNRLKNELRVLKMKLSSLKRQVRGKTDTSFQRNAASEGEVANGIRALRRTLLRLQTKCEEVNWHAADTLSSSAGNAQSSESGLESRKGPSNESKSREKVEAAGHRKHEEGVQQVDEDINVREMLQDLRDLAIEDVGGNTAALHATPDREGMDNGTVRLALEVDDKRQLTEKMPSPFHDSASLRTLSSEDTVEAALSSLALITGQLSNLKGREPGASLSMRLHCSPYQRILVGETQQNEESGTLSLVTVCEVSASSWLASSLSALIAPAAPSTAPRLGVDSAIADDHGVRLGRRVVFRARLQLGSSSRSSKSAATFYFRFVGAGPTGIDDTETSTVFVPCDAMGNRIFNTWNQAKQPEPLLGIDRVSIDAPRRANLHDNFHQELMPRGVVPGVAAVDLAFAVLQPHDLIATRTQDESGKKSTQSAFCVAMQQPSFDEFGSTLMYIDEGCTIIVIDEQVALLRHAAAVS